MENLGNGVMIDPNKQFFIIQGYGEIRIQNNPGRIYGVTLEQLALMLKTLKGKKSEQKPNNGDVVKATSRKTRAVGRRNATAS